MLVQTSSEIIGEPNFEENKKFCIYNNGELIILFLRKINRHDDSIYDRLFLRFWRIFRIETNGDDHQGCSHQKHEIRPKIEQNPRPNGCSNDCGTLRPLLTSKLQYLGIGFENVIRIFNHNRNEETSGGVGYGQYPNKGVESAEESV